MGLLPDTQHCGLHTHRECRESFPRHQLQRKPLVSDPDMHYGMCVTHVPWCWSGSLAPGIPGIPSACATHNFTYLARGPWRGSPKVASRFARWKAMLVGVLIKTCFMAIIYNWELRSYAVFVESPFNRCLRSATEFNWDYGMDKYLHLLSYLRISVVDVITYPCPKLSWSLLVKWGPGVWIF